MYLHCDYCYLIWKLEIFIVRISKEKGNGMVAVKEDTWWDKGMYWVLLLLAFASNLSTGATSCALGVGALLMIIQGIKTRQLPKIDKGLGRVILMYLLLWCIVAAHSTEPLKSFGDVWATTYRFLPLFFAMIYIKKPEQLKGFFIAFACSVLINDVHVFQQMIMKPGLRPTGFNNTATFLASHMLMAIPMMFLAAKQRFFSMKLRWGMLAIGFLSILVLLVSETRGGWVAFLVGSVLFILLSKKYRRKALAGMGMLLLFITVVCMAYTPFQQRVISTTDMHHSNNTERILMWQSALGIFRDYPVFGVGQDRFGYYYNTQYISPLAKERSSSGDYQDGHGHPHNNILKMAAEGGVVGLGAYLLLHGYVLYRLVCQYRKERWLELSYALIGILIFVGIQMEGLTDTNINQVPIMREYWLLMGILLAGGGVLEKVKAESGHSKE